MRKNIKAWLWAAISGLMFFPTLTLAQQSDPYANCRKFKDQFNLKTGNPFDWVNLSRFCTVQDFVLWALKNALGMAGVVAVVFIVIGGYQYMTSGGNEEAAEKGRKTLINSVIGLVVIIMSFVIVRVVTNLITSQSP